MVKCETLLFLYWFNLRKVFSSNHATCHLLQQLIHRMLAPKQSGNRELFLKEAKSKWQRDYYGNDHTEMLNTPISCLIFVHTDFETLLVHLWCAIFSGSFDHWGEEQDSGSGCNLPKPDHHVFEDRKNVLLQPWLHNEASFCFDLFIRRHG